MVDRSPSSLQGESSSSMIVKVERLVQKHWPAVSRIYAEGIHTGNATFETEVPSWQAWNRSHRRDCRIVAIVNGTTAGWAALCPVSLREVYVGVAEVSVYVTVAAQGRGVGRTLLTALVTESENAGVWTLQASIFPENLASIALHRSCGFREVGVRSRLGRLAGVWRDVLLLERRSQEPQFD